MRVGATLCFCKDHCLQQYQGNLVVLGTPHGSRTIQLLLVRQEPGQSARMQGTGGPPGPAGALSQCVLNMLAKVALHKTIPLPNHEVQDVS